MSGWIEHGSYSAWLRPENGEVQANYGELMVSERLELISHLWMEMEMEMCTNGDVHKRYGSGSGTVYIPEIGQLALPSRSLSTNGEMQESGPCTFEDWQNKIFYQISFSTMHGDLHNAAHLHGRSWSALSN